VNLNQQLDSVIEAGFLLCNLLSHSPCLTESDDQIRRFDSSNELASASEAMGEKLFS
jgi:hypothetical protein